MKTMAIRIDDERHTQLSVFAQLAGTSITELIRTALDEHLDRLRAQPELVAQAQALLTEIDAEAANRRNVVAAMLSTDATSTANAKDTPVTSRRGKASTATKAT